MKWLLTVGKGVDLDVLRAELAQLDSTLGTESPVPLADEEKVVPAEGPTDLPARLAAARIYHVKAYPDSELELYEPI